MGFWAVAYAFVVTMAFSSAPTPLYVLYEQRDGFSTLVGTVVFAVYALGVIASLLLAGHSSDRLGRKRALVPAVALSAVSAVLFLLWRDLPGLLLARVLSGLSVGVVTATASAYLTELNAARGPGASPRRAAVAITVANLGGIGLGPLISGLIAQSSGAPLTVPFLLFAPALALAALAVAVVPPETVDRARLPAPPAARPWRIAIPAGDCDRRRFFAAAGGAAIAFAAFGLFTSLDPIFLADTLGHHSRSLAGAAVALVFAAAVATQLLAARRDVGAQAQLRLGVAGVLAGPALLLLAVWLPSPSLALYLAGGGVTGAGAGLLFRGALATVVTLADDEHRAEVLSGFYLAAYLGTSLPAVGLGALAGPLDTRAVLTVFVVAVVLAVLAAAPRLLDAGARAAR